MSYGEYLQELLRPLGIYNPEGSFQRGELESAGISLDGVEAMLEEVQRESNLLTAKDWGVTRIGSLLTHPPVARAGEEMGAALAALLRIGGDGFTMAAINDALSGCGISARAEETGVGRVRVRFPEQAGVPAGFEQIERCIRELLPAHLGVEFWFRFITWAELEQQFSAWEDLQNQTWAELEVKVIW